MDYSILVLGRFYVLVMAAYIFFEFFVINYRPVLIDGYLEASYPSSDIILMVFMVVGRLISGVHWFTDIIGGILLSLGFVMLYDTIIRRMRCKDR